VIAKQWDQRHLKIGQRTGDLAKLAKEKWQDFDEKYRVQQKMDTATKTTVDAVKAFDEKQQISRRLSETAKNLNEKYEISATMQSQVNKIKSNENVQKVSTKVWKMVKSGLNAFDQLSKETKQLVNEKEAEQSKTEEKKEETEGHEINRDSPPNVNENVSSVVNENGDKEEETAPGMSTELQV